MAPDDVVRQRAAAGIRSLLRRGAPNPVPAILLLAGAFDLLAGDFMVHGLALFAVAGALLWDARSQRAGPPAQAPAAPALEATTARRSVPPAPIAIAGVAYAIVVGGFARYSWPASLAVSAVAAGAVALAWRTPSARQVPLPVSRRGSLAWAAVFVSLALEELTALLLQPSLTNDSYAHSTISALMDSVLATPLGRSIFLAAWLGAGYALLAR